MSGARRESELRDFLAGRLEVIDPRLTLERLEYPLPNDLGSRGRIDLLARDPDGVLVVIELKRSDASARQAIHELNKYTGLIVTELGLGPTDVRCLLLATSWRELLVPFSQFVRGRASATSARPERGLQRDVAEFA